MINSRKLEDLTPEAASRATKLIALCAAQGIDLLVTSTFRDFESQTAIYNQGRTQASIAKGEKIVTNAKAGMSYHNYRVAFDVVPLVNGKPNWDNLVLWKKIGELGRSCGLEWAGDWRGSFKEMAHFQFTNGKTLDDLRKEMK